MRLNNLQSRLNIGNQELKITIADANPGLIVFFEEDFDGVIEGVCSLPTF